MINFYRFYKLSLIILGQVSSVLLIFCSKPSFFWFKNYVFSLFWANLLFHPKYFFTIISCNFFLIFWAINHLSLSTELLFIDIFVIFCLKSRFCPFFIPKNFSKKNLVIFLTNFINFQAISYYFRSSNLCFIEFFVIFVQKRHFLIQKLRLSLFWAIFFHYSYFFTIISH